MSAKIAGSRVEIRVRDHGIGIRPDLLDRVFDLFVQQPQSLDRSAGGLGLGLAIVKSLVTSHGGSVHVESAGPGTGSEFIVNLPSLSASADATMIRPEGDVTDAARGHPARRVLVVDDNEDGAEMLASSLELMGHHVRVAHDGRAALDAAANFHPDVALLDIGLPVMDGYELASRLRDLPDGRDIHLVAVTGYGQQRDRAGVQGGGLRRARREARGPRAPAGHPRGGRQRIDAAIDREQVDLAPRWNTKKRAARVAGLWYLGMALSGPIGIVYVSIEDHRGRRRGSYCGEHRRA